MRMDGGSRTGRRREKGSETKQTKKEKTKTIARITKIEKKNLYRNTNKKKKKHHY